MKGRVGGESRRGAVNFRTGGRVYWVSSTGRQWISIATTKKEVGVSNSHKVTRYPSKSGKDSHWSLLGDEEPGFDIEEQRGQEISSIQVT